MNHREENSPQDFIAMVVIFILFFWLLYSIASALQKARKIEAEVQTIRDYNEKTEAAIKQKERKRKYLETPQRIEKEAKTQLNKKRPNETVIVLIEEQKKLLPTEEKIEYKKQKVQQLSNPEKWWYVFFGERKNTP